jgi:hypothetical protein
MVDEGLALILGELRHRFVILEVLFRKVSVYGSLRGESTQPDVYLVELVRHVSNAYSQRTLREYGAAGELLRSTVQLR